MRVPEDDMARFESLDDDRRRIYEDLNALVQKIREGSVSDDERLTRDAQFLQVRHQQIIRNMIDLLVY
jgi:hypothetical protein